jgi:hypothetical protein
VCGRVKQGGVGGWYLVGVACGRPLAPLLLSAITYTDIR